MMRKINLWHYMCALLLLLVAVQGCRKDYFYDERGGSTDPLLLQAAKVWHQQNLEFVQKRRSKRSDLDITKLHFQWDKHVVSKNQEGTPVLSVPLRYAGQAEGSYVELGFIVDAQGNSNGMIKEYLGDPFVGNTPLNLYSGTGHLFMSGTFDRSRKSMAISISRSQQLKSGVNKISFRSGGNEPVDNILLEEIIVIGQQTKMFNEGNVLGVLSGGQFHEVGISDNSAPPGANGIEEVTVWGYSNSGSGIEVTYQGTYSHGDYSGIPVTPEVTYIVVALDPSQQTPCARAKARAAAIEAALANPTVHNQMTALKALAENSSLEHGFAITKTGNTYGVTPIVTGTATSIDFTDLGSDVIALVHTHPVGTASIHSSTDIYGLNDFKDNAGFLGSIVVRGEDIHLLSVTDPGAYDAFIQKSNEKGWYDSESENGWKRKTPIYNSYNALSRSFTDMYTSQDATYPTMLYIMHEYNMGLSLQRWNDVGFEPIKTDAKRNMSTGSSSTVGSGMQPISSRYESITIKVDCK